MTSSPRPPAAQDAILDATERLLGDTPFADIAVGDIIAAAGVSRTSFYAHFGSRAAVLAACLRRAAGEIGGALQPSAGEADPGRPGADPTGAVRARLRRWVALAGEHGPLLRTVSEEWPHDPALRELWFSTIAGFTHGTADAIDRARAAGAAPPGADAEALATVLMWGCEQVLHVALVGEAEGLREPAAIVEPLVRMIAGGAFGA